MTYNSRLLPEVVETPFIYEIRDIDGTVIAKYDMLLYAGIIGLSEDPVNGALKPEIGWMVRCIIPEEERDYYYDSIRTDIPNVFGLPLQNDEKTVNRLITSSANFKDRSLEMENPLVVHNGNIVKVDQKKLSVMVSNDDFTQESVADLLGLKTKQIKDITTLKVIEATAIWGMRGRNGVLEVSSDIMKEQSKKKNRKKSR
jgi:hypothetical protein